MQFVFDDHVLDTDKYELHRGPEPIAVEPQVFDLLVLLLEKRDRVVTKDELIASVWNCRIVSDSTLTSRVNAARKAIGDNGKEQRLIRTIARRGLRFVGDVHIRSDNEILPFAETALPGTVLRASMHKPFHGSLARTNGR